MPGRLRHDDLNNRTFLFFTYPAVETGRELLSSAACYPHINSPRLLDLSVICYSLFLRSHMCFHNAGPVLLSHRFHHPFSTQSLVMVQMCLFFLESLLGVLSPQHWTRGFVFIRSCVQSQLLLCCVTVDSCLIYLCQ